MTAKLETLLVRPAEWGDFVMPVSMKSLGLDSLSVDDRIALALEHWESIEPVSTEFELTESHRQHLQRRLDAHRNDPQAGSSWQEAKARLQQIPQPPPDLITKF